jgi:hypothetical protein
VSGGYTTKDSGKREGFGTGAVRDVRSGKGRYDLMSFLALHRIAGVYERGAAKYDDRNWEQGIPISRNIDSALRHVSQYMLGEDDEDHLAQAAWNLIAALHFDEGIKRELYPRELDDRPRYPVVSAVTGGDTQEQAVYLAQLRAKSNPDMEYRDESGFYSAEAEVVHPYTPDMSEHSEGQDHLGRELHAHNDTALLHSHDMDHHILIDRST